MPSGNRSDAGGYPRSKPKGTTQRPRTCWRKKMQSDESPFTTSPPGCVDSQRQNCRKGSSGRGPKEDCDEADPLDIGYALEQANQSDVKEVQRIGNLLVRKSTAGGAHHHEDVAEISRRRFDSLRMLERRHSVITAAKTSKQDVARQYLMLSDLLHVIGAQMDPSNARRGHSDSMVELMTTLRIYAKDLISCDRCSLFIKVKKGDTYVLWTIIEEDGSEISIPMDSGFAGAAIMQRSLVRADDAYEDHRFNCEVDKFTGYVTKAIMCAPVFRSARQDGETGSSSDHTSPQSSDDAIFHEDILGVLQVFNKTSVGGNDEEESRVFSEYDESVLRSMASMAAVTIMTTKALESERIAKDRFAALGSIAKMLLRQSTANVKSLCQHIQSEAARLCQCEHALIYVYDKGHSRLEVETADGTHLTLKLPWQSTSGRQGGKEKSAFVAGHCFCTGALVNIPDVHVDERWAKCLERSRLSFKALHALIALPILRQMTDGSSEIIGVLQAVNKKDSSGRHTGFDVDDEHLLEGLCVYVASALSTSSAFQATASSYHVRADEFGPLEGSSGQKSNGSRPNDWLSMTSAMSVTRAEKLGSDGHIACDEITLKEAGLHDWNFDAALWTEDELSRLAHPAFGAFDLAREFRISESSLSKFTAEVAKGYNKIPFHSYFHAWTVLQACVHMCWTLDVADVLNEVLIKVDVLALLVAALCHDMGHPGTNNSFQQRICSPLALLYNDQSILENHHAASCFKVLCSSPDVNILGNLSECEFRSVRRFICAAILSTDMSRHHRDLARLTARAATPISKESEDDRELTVCAMLHAADLSNPARPPDLAESWARRLAEEFRLQTEKEIEAGIAVSTFMLGGYKDSNEIFFINTFAKPLWDSLAVALPPLKTYVSKMTDNAELCQRRLAEQLEATEDDKSPNHCSTAA